MNQHSIKLIYSQVTLKPLTDPFFHVEQGCQFDCTDLIQKPKSKSIQTSCPVCQNSGTLQEDVELKLALIEKTDKQLVQNKTNSTIKQLSRTAYYYSNRSSDRNVQLQQVIFNSQINTDQIKLSMNFIEKLNQERIREYFQIIKSLPNNEWNRKPTLIGVIRHKLIIYYHTYKIKLELDLYDETNQNKIKKMNQYNSGIITQVEFFQNKIQLIVQNQSLFQLYSGDFQQVYQPENTEPIFKVTQLPGYTMKYFARLIQKPDGQCLMIGGNHLRLLLAEGNMIVDYEQKDTEFNMNCAVKGLNQHTHIVVAPNGTVIIANSETKSLEEVKYLNNSVEIRQGLRLSSNLNFDSAILFSNKMILVNSAHLQLSKFTAQCVIQGNLNSQQFQASNLNHCSYMKVIMIPSTPAKYDTITCYLVGFLLPQQTQYEEEDVILPGLLVYNNQKTSFEIELL